MAEKQLTDYDRLLKKYVAAEKNLTNNPEKCGGVDYIKGYMSGLLEGMALVNPAHQSVCMEEQNREVDDDNR